MEKNDIYEEFKEKISYLSKDEIKKIEKAYEYAKNMHFGQKRVTGEDYIIHPVSVAIILTDIKADCDTLCAALLHDVIEDTDTTKEDILRLFGKTVANLVDGVSKINNIKISTENEYLTSYYKKIIVGMSEDVRVIIIKLADRLHNMRTLYVMPKETQKRKAKETLEILSPIAHRLGMNKIKSELEDLSLRYLKPDVYFDIAEKLNKNKTEREELVKIMMKEVRELLDKNGIKHDIKGRAKSIYSIYNKLDKGKSFSNIYDLLAMRILVNTKEECYQTLGFIHSKYKPVPKRFKDYIAMPKTNLYQSLHTTIFGIDGHLFEIQIRTYAMDETAENGIASHWAYKENKNASTEMQNITEKKLQFYKSIIELYNDKMTNEEFIDTVKQEVLNNNIYVYTPLGDVFELPNGATPIDFAYRVHSKVGDSMTGAIVNDNIVPLSYELKNGDIVKIITNKNSTGPNYEWINIAKTVSAKNKIKSFFNKQNKEEYILLGKTSLEKELKKNKISLNDFYEKSNLDSIFTEFKLKDIDDLYLNIGNNKFSPKTIIRKENEDTKIEKEIAREIKEKNEGYTSDILVGDSGDIKTHIASCCKPLPGDEICGYITRNTGISIHRAICPNVSLSDEKSVDVKWNNDTKNKYETEVIVYTNSNKNIILDLIQSTINNGLQADNINIINKGNKNVYSVIVRVSNKEEVEHLEKEYKKLKDVTIAERIMK